MNNFTELAKKSGIDASALASALSNVVPTNTIVSSSAAANNADMKMSPSDLKIIMDHIDTVLLKYYPPETISKAIFEYIDTLKPLGEFDVNRIMLNAVFSQINLLSQPLNNYKLMIPLLNNPEIITIVNGATLLKKQTQSFVDSLKENVFSDNENIVSYQKQMGGEGTTGETTEGEKIDDVVLKKTERLLQMDLPDEKILNKFYSYIENFFKGESPEKTKIFNHLTAKLDEFIDSLFTNNTFQSLKFHKYLFLALLQNNDIASKINAITFTDDNNKMVELLKTTFEKLVAPPTPIPPQQPPTPTPPPTIGGSKRRKKTLNRKEKGAKKHKRTIKKRRIR